VPGRAQKRQLIEDNMYTSCHMSKLLAIRYVTVMNPSFGSFASSRHSGGPGPAGRMSTWQNHRNGTVPSFYWRLEYEATA
jgi:hypothetical protein